MTEVQQELFGLLCELDDICRANDITYYLIGGSALGAVRHHGFLPWDDDADIVLTKQNWEKLKPILENSPYPNRKLVSWEDDDDEPSVFFRYVDTTKTFLLHSMFYKSMPWGNIIDIFVLNPLPVNKKEWPAYHKTMRRFGEYVMQSAILCCSKASPLTYHWDTLRGRILGRARVRKMLYKKLSCYSEKECEYYSYLYARIHIVYKKEIFQKPRYCMFEGRLLPVPTQVEEHFRILFGDNWYDIPSEQEKIVHFAAHDTKHSYKEYMYDYSHYMNSKKIKKVALQAKCLKIWASVFSWKYRTYLCRKKAQYLSSLLQNYYGEREIQRKEMMLQQDFNGLLQMYDVFYQEQLNADMQEQQEVISLTGEQMYEAVYSLILSGKNRKAQKILDIQHEEQEWARPLKKMLKEKNEAFILFEAGNYEVLYPVIVRLARTYPKDKDIAFILLSFAAKNQSYMQKCKKHLERYISYIMDTWPEATEFNKFKADIELLSGNIEQAKNLYLEVQERTRNGMILLDVQKQMEKMR